MVQNLLITTEFEGLYYRISKIFFYGTLFFIQYKFKNFHGIRVLEIPFFVTEYL